MTYDEFHQLLSKAGLTIRDFAALVKMNHNSVTNCAKRGSVPSHLAIIVTLMGEMAENKIDFRDALSKLEIKTKQPRGGATKGRFGGTKQIGMPLKL